MSDIRTSFSYVPFRQGYDTNSWKTISGAPALAAAGRLVVDVGTGTPGYAIHYADFLKGDFSFDVNIASAPGGDFRSFGMTSASSYIKFSISGSLTCQTSDGATTTISDPISWDSSWSGANVVFRIRWEPSCAKFFINGTQVCLISGSSVPHGPLSLFLYDNATTAMTVGDISVKGTQSFVMNPKSSDSTAPVFTGSLLRSDTVTITEATTINVV